MDETETPTTDVETEVPVPSGVEIRIVIVGDRFDVNIEGASVLELPTRLRLTALAVERQLGIT